MKKKILKLIKGYEEDKDNILEGVKKAKTIYQKRQAQKDLEVFYTLTDVIEDLKKLLKE